MRDYKMLFELALRRMSECAALGYEHCDDEGAVDGLIAFLYAIEEELDRDDLLLSDFKDRHARCHTATWLEDNGYKNLRHYCQYHALFDTFYHHDFDYSDYEKKEITREIMERSRDDRLFWDWRKAADRIKGHDHDESTLITKEALHD